MSLLMLLAALAVIGVLAAVVTGRLDPSLPPPTPSSPHRPLPDGALSPGDVDGLRFSLAVRGYRMDEVDSVLARLRAELAMLQDQLAARDGQDPIPATTGPVTAALPAAGRVEAPDVTGTSVPADTGDVMTADRRHGRRSATSTWEP